MQAEWIPEGVFQCHPQQGFTGRAALLKIHQHKQQAALQKDSNTLQLSRQDQSHHEALTRVTERERENVKDRRLSSRMLFLTGGCFVLLLGYGIILFLTVRNKKKYLS